MQEITAAAANGAKAKFERIQDPGKLRRVALQTATQQNLATCVALLKEIAVHFGYSLAVEDGISSLPLSFCCIPSHTAFDASTAHQTCHLIHPH